jgi:hypothetical protein
MTPNLFVACHDLFVSVMPLAVVAFTTAVILMMRDREWALMTLLGFWGGLFFLCANTDAYTPRHLDMVIIPCHIMVGYALGRIARQWRLTAVALAVTGALFMWAQMYPRLEFRHGYNGEKRFAQFVKAVTEPGAVIITMDQYVFLTYYGKLKVLWLPLNNPGHKDVFVDEVKALLKGGVPVYYAESSYILEKEDLPLRLVSDYFKVRPVGSLLMEEYHRPELEFTFITQTLYRVLAPKDKAI